MKKIMSLFLIVLIMIIGVNSVSAKNCSDYKGPTECQNSVDPACVWNKKNKICSVDGLVYVACGSENLSVDKICKGKAGNAAYDIPQFIPKLTSFFVNALKIATPIILIFVGMISLVKAIASTNEDDIKKAQNALVKKVLIAVMVFFVIAITQFIINKVADDDPNSTSDEQGSANGCLACFLNNNCSPTYYRDASADKQCIKIK